MLPVEVNPNRFAERRRRRRRAIARRRALFAGVVSAAIVGIAAWWVLAGSEAPAGRQPVGASVPESHGLPSTASAPAPRTTLSEQRTGGLRSALQDAAATAVGGRVALLGGLNAADASTDAVQVATASRAAVVGRLPVALHDAAAISIGGEVYLLGGGDGTAQLDAIRRVDLATGTTHLAGRLPAPNSDLAAVTVGDTVYAVGGYTGSRWLDTIVAWRPGGSAHVVARLPHALRYPAVAAVDGRVVIAGGSTPQGADSAVMVFDPHGTDVRTIGRLPAATTHAAAAALGHTVYVIGGRGASVGTPSDRIVAVELATRRVRPAGRLLSPRSDLAAVTVGERVVLFGGRGLHGTTSGISTLRPAVPVPATTGGSAVNVYAHDGPNMLSPTVQHVPLRIYVPNSKSNTVDVIDPRTGRVVGHFAVGAQPQHVTPSWDLKTLYVLNDQGNSVTPIDPRTARVGRPIPVDDPYNMYFTPDGRFAIVVAERNARLDFRDPHTMQLRHSLSVPCRGVDHMDFTADGRTLLASCEFSGQALVVDVASQRVTGTITLGGGRAMPQDVKLAPDGAVFYVADMMRGGLYLVDAKSFRPIGFLPTGRGAHGLYPSRDARVMYISNRDEGSISIVNFARRAVVGKWRLPGRGSPDMGGVSPDGRTLWLSGRYDGVVYAIDTRTGRLRARIRVGSGPHGLSVWPQPGRYSLGHTGILR